MFNLTKKICKPLSVSGREQAVCGVIAEEIAPYVDSVSTDALGNLIAFKAGNAENKKKLMRILADMPDELLDKMLEYLESKYNA